MAYSPVLIVVDDAPDILPMLRRFGEGRAFSVATFGSGQEALDYLAQHAADVALVDVNMPGVGGLDVLRSIRATAPECRVVLMTGEPDMGVAIEAIRLGALDVVPKPIDFDRLSRILDDVKEENARQRQVRVIEQHLAARLDFHGMIGRSGGMENLFSLIRRLAPHVRAAIVTGETGTGKELVARALHARGPRASRPMVTLNCAALVPTLVESELFGHARGAFTGAHDPRAGVFELADRGTLFLDEIGELPLEAQAKLLRVLESGETRRVGASESKRVDVHVIAATNRDLAVAVAAGRFRGDLYYRLNVVELHVPPLRDRKDDIPFLVAGFIREFAGRFDKTIVGVTSTVEQSLLDGTWPGNVRQLRNVIERACLLADREWITEAELEMPTAIPSESAAALPLAPLRDLERSAVVSALQAAGHNKTHAAARLGVSRRALYRLMDAYGLRDPNP